MVFRQHIRLFIVITLLFGAALLTSVIIRTAAAQSVGNSVQRVTLPNKWTADSDSITINTLSTAMPPLQVTSGYEMQITKIEENEGLYYRFLPGIDEAKSKPTAPLQVTWTITDAALQPWLGNVIQLSIHGRGYAPPPGGIRFFIQETNGTEFSSSSVYLNEIQWADYAVVRRPSMDAKQITVGFEWDPTAADNSWLEIEPLRVEAFLPETFTGEAGPTDLPPTPTFTPTATPTYAYIVVTSTPKPTDVFEEATRVATYRNAVAAGDPPTATPENMVTATFTPLPLVVINTPTPGNQATAQAVALRSTAEAFTTGTPTPIPDDAVVVTATPAQRPTRTPTPYLVLLDDIPPTAEPLPTPVFPEGLVGKILFQADFSGNPRRPDYMVMNPDGTMIGRLTSSQFYLRAVEQDQTAPGGNRTAMALHSQTEDRTGRIQIFVENREYGTLRPITFFGAGTAWDPVWSPTGEQVAFVSNESKNDEIWIVTVDEWPAIQLTRNEWPWDHHPSFSPDGSQIIFSSNRSGRQQLWIMDADGGNQRQLTDFEFEAWNPVWVK